MPLVPSSAVKLCRFVKPVPSVLTLNTVPLPEPPPKDNVPYRMLLDKSKRPYGTEPSLAEKLCKVVKVCADVRPVNIKLRLTIRAGISLAKFREWFKLIIIVSFELFCAFSGRAILPTVNQSEIPMAKDRIILRKDGIAEEILE